MKIVNLLNSVLGKNPVPSQVIFHKKDEKLTYHCLDDRIRPQKIRSPLPDERGKDVLLKRDKQWLK